MKKFQQRIAFSQNENEVFTYENTNIMKEEDNENQLLSTSPEIKLKCIFIYLIQNCISFL